MSLSSEGSGIYKLILDKKVDQIYKNASTGNMILKKKPDPIAEFYLTGDGK